MPNEPSAQPTVGAPEPTPAPTPAPEPAKPAEQATPPVEVPEWVNRPAQPPVQQVPQYPGYPQYAAPAYPPQYPTYTPPAPQAPQLSFDDLVANPAIVDQRAAMAVAPVVQRLAQLDQFSRAQFESNLNHEVGTAQQAIVNGYTGVFSRDPAYANPQVKATIDSLLQNSFEQAKYAAIQTGDMRGLREMNHPKYMQALLAVAKVHAGYPGGETPGPMQVRGAVVESSRSVPQTGTPAVEITEELRDSARRMGVEPEVLAGQLAKALEERKKLGWDK